MPPRPLLALLLAACQLPPTSSDDAGDTPAITTLTPSTGSTSGAHDDTTGAVAPGSTTSDPAASSTSAASDSSNTAPPIFDLGTDADLGAQQPPGCQGKVDLLFVLSREAGMKDRQVQLMSAIPKFAAIIQNKFSDFDYHIMVIDGDAGWGLDSCNDQCTPQGCEYVPDYPCDQLDLVTWCDEALGAGTVFNAGGHAANKPCDIAGGKRFLTPQQPDLTATFACIAQVGTSGYGQLGDALMNAMSSQLSGPGGCNDKFLRKDALLMVTLIGGSDLENAPSDSLGTPDEWAQAVLAAKHGDYESVVMLSITTTDLDCPWWGDRICTLANIFPYHHVANALSSDYVPAFDAATDLVEKACAGFTPPPG